MLKTASNTTFFFSNLYITIKSKSLPIFKLAVIINLPKNLDSFKKPIKNSPYLFEQLFLSRKSTKINSLDNNLLIQIIEKIESLIKFFRKWSKHIKQFEDKINNFIKINKNAKRNLTFFSQPIIAL